MLKYLKYILKCISLSNLIKYYSTLLKYYIIQQNPVCVFSGVWATKLGEMAGVNVPLIAMHHAYIVTERIEGIQVSF